MLNLEAADPNMRIMLTKKLQKEIPQEYQIKVGNHGGIRLHRRTGQGGLSAFPPQR